MTITVNCSNTTIFNQTGTANLYLKGSLSATAASGIMLTPLTAPGAYSFIPTVSVGEYRVDLVATGATNPFWTGWVEISATSGTFEAHDSIEGALMSFDSNNNLNANVVDVAGSASQGAAGYVGLDWSKINAPTTTQNLSGTTVATVTTLTNYTAPNNSGISSIVAKLPTNNIADETLIISATNSILSAVGTPMQSGSVPAVNVTKWLGQNATADGNNLPIVSPSSLGTGTYAVEIAINDGTNPIQFANVSAWSGSTLKASGETNSNGQITFALSAGTYTINVMATGFNGSSNSLTVSSSGTTTYSLSAITITPSTPPAVTGYATTMDALGTTAVPNVAFTCQMIALPAGSTGTIPDSTPNNVTSNGAGLLEITGLQASAEFLLTNVATGNQLTFTAASSGTFAINGGIL